ncbi:MAG: hypothetical protein EA358_08700 [Flavobacteriales bacterium]|nr:MAG: hypothetical protein EA358_08700 [Flavobacteriales bacterium]
MKKSFEPTHANDALDIRSKSVLSSWIKNKSYRNTARRDSTIVYKDRLETDEFQGNHSNSELSHDRFDCAERKSSFTHEIFHSHHDYAIETLPFVALKNAQENSSF